MNERTRLVWTRRNMARQDEWDWTELGGTVDQVGDGTGWEEKE